MSLDLTRKWFEIAIQKITPDSQRIQFFVHCEEFVEMLDTVKIEGQEALLLIVREALHKLAENGKTDPTAKVVVTDRKEFLDSIADQYVTLTGVAFMNGMDSIGALNNVNESNFSKFVDGKAIFNESGKISKGIFYKPPNLEPYVGYDPVKIN